MIELLHFSTGKSNLNEVERKEIDRSIQLAYE